jgi:hypothetical protein
LRHHSCSPRRTDPLVFGFASIGSIRGPIASAVCGSSRTTGQGEGLSSHPEDAELWFRCAVVHRHRGESAQAESCWWRILSWHRPEQYCSIDEGIYGHITRRNLAVLAVERGDHAEAARLWRAVLAECPGDRVATANLERLAPSQGTGHRIEV